MPKKDRNKKVEFLVGKAKKSYGGEEAEWRTIMESLKADDLDTVGRTLDEGSETKLHKFFRRFIKVSS